LETPGFAVSDRKGDLDRIVSLREAFAAFIRRSLHLHVLVDNVCLLGKIETHDERD